MKHQQPRQEEHKTLEVEMSVLLAEYEVLKERIRVVERIWKYAEQVQRAVWPGVKEQYMQMIYWVI